MVEPVDGSHDLMMTRPLLTVAALWKTIVTGRSLRPELAGSGNVADDP